MTALLHSEFAGDVALWFVFFLGQCLFVLKRSAFVIRNPNTAIRSFSDYVRANLDIFCVRFLVEIPLIFWPWRHVSIVSMAGFFGWTLPAWFPVGAGTSVAATFAVGYAADSIADALSQSPKLPEFLRTFLKEQIPILPETPTVRVTTEVQGTEVVTKAEVLPEEGKKSNPAVVAARALHNGATALFNQNPEIGRSDLELAKANPIPPAAPVVDEPIMRRLVTAHLPPAKPPVPVKVSAIEQLRNADIATMRPLDIFNLTLKVKRELQEEQQ